MTDLIRRAARALPALALAALLAACGDAAADPPDRAGLDPHAGHAAPPPPAAEISSHSVYHLPSEWLDQEGARRTLGSLGGRVQVVAMAYTSCAYACPRLLLDMKRIEGELGPDADVGFVLVSIDPARDTPARLAEYATGARLDPARWTLLTGDDDAVLELAAVLGVQYREAAPGEFVHSNLLTVLDADGTPVHRQEGLGADPAATLRAIRARL